jgi:hypothetical protein
VFGWCLSQAKRKKKKKKKKKIIQQTGCTICRAEKNGTHDMQSRKKNPKKSQAAQHKPEEKRERVKDESNVV